MTTSIIRAGGTGVPGVQTTGGDDGALALKVGPLAATVEALNISSTGTGAFVGQVTATGFTGTLDGILGSGTPAAATVTTFTSNGIDDNADALAITIDSSENVGIGTASPDAPLSVFAVAAQNIAAHLSSASGAIIQFTDQGSKDWGLGIDDGTSALTFFENRNISTAGTARMTVASGGNVGIGTALPSAKLEVSGTIASSGIHTVGTNSSGNSATLQQADGFNFKLNGDTASQLGQVSWTNNSAAVTGNMWGTGDGSSGTVLRVKSLGVVSLVPGNVGIDASAGYNFTTAAFTPPSDNGDTNGTASLRWSVVYAGTGTINTSDEREKQQIADLDAAELRVALAIKGMVKKFKFNDAVTAKGDNARIHVGVIAQDVRGAFIAEGLDPTQYALFCYDAWPEIAEETDDEGTIMTQAREAGDRFGIRYDELLAFIIAAV